MSGPSPVTTFRVGYTTLGTRSSAQRAVQRRTIGAAGDEEPLGAAAPSTPHRTGGGAAVRTRIPWFDRPMTARGTPRRRHRVVHAPGDAVRRSVDDGGAARRDECRETSAGIVPGCRLRRRCRPAAAASGGAEPARATAVGTRTFDEVEGDGRAASPPACAAHGLPGATYAVRRRAGDPDGSEAASVGRAQRSDPRLALRQGSMTARDGTGASPSTTRAGRRTSARRASAVQSASAAAAAVCALARLPGTLPQWAGPPRMAKKLPQPYFQSRGAPMSTWIMLGWQ